MIRLFAQQGKTVMNRSAFFKLAASGLVIATGLGLPTAAVVAGDSRTPEVNPARAGRAAERAGEEMQRGRQERALRYAEEAVAMAPEDSSYRVLLGQAYLANGRFASAEASFGAARDLGSTDSRAIIGHALSMIAVGRAAEAAALVDANAATLPASDFGLALALSGQPERGAMILTDVVRAGGSTARDRQNLALSYALAGRWLEARLIAGQDLSPAVAGERMTQWAAMTQAGDPRLRIAGLIGAEIQEDPGMPVRLALRGGAAAPVALAQAEDPAPLALYAPAPMQNSAELVDELLDAPQALPEPTPVMMAAAEPAPAPASALSAEEQAIVFVSNPVIQPLRGIVAMVAPLANPSAAAAPAPAPQARPVRVAGRAAVAAAPVAAPVAAAVPVRAARATGPVRTSGWAVQLGAFDSVGVAQDGWSRASRRFGAQLAGKDGVSTSATVGGTTVYRLAATGFDSRAEAQTACSAIVRSGGSCFVRQIATGEPVRWASRQTPTRVAAR